MGHQDSQNDSQDTDSFWDFLQRSASQVLGFLESSPPSADGSREMPRELSLHRTMSPTPSRHLSLNLEGLESAQLETRDTEQGVVEQWDKGSISEGNKEMMCRICRVCVE